MNDDFHAIRRTGIGGSDAGAILGLSPWKSPLDVYLEKIGEVDSSQDTAATYWGRKLEDLVADEYAVRTGRRVERCNDTLRHPLLEWQMAHVDRLVWRDGQRPRVRGQIRTDRILECKTAGAHMAAEWGPEGTDQIPEAYIAQVQHYLAVTGCEVADLAVLIGGRDFRVYEIPRDNELIHAIIEAESEFWWRCQDRRPPDPQSLADLAKRWPRDTGGTVVADAVLVGAVDALREMKAQQKTLDADIDALEAAVKKVLMDNATLAGPDGRPLATWKVQSTKRLDQARLTAAHADLVAQYITESTTRVFRLASQKALKEAA
jgi:putative phage-type endonuclease